MKRRRVPYSAEEMRWLENNRHMIISDYHAAFVAAFQREDITATNLHALRKRKGWKVGRAPGRFAGRSWKFSAAEIAWLKENCRMVIGEYHRVFCAAFLRTDVTAGQLLALRKRKGWRTGRTGQFQKGMASYFRGKKRPFHPNSAHTQFKKGQLPHNYRGAGHERIIDGYVVLIVAEKNPWTGAATRPVFKHRWLWEKLNGPVPDGMVLKCLDGNRLNTDPSNWKAIPRAILPRLSHRYGRGYDDAPEEIKPTILAVAELEHELRQKQQKRPRKAKAHA